MEEIEGTNELLLVGHGNATRIAFRVGWPLVGRRRFGAGTRYEVLGIFFLFLSFFFP